MRRSWRRTKALWDEYRITKQVSEGQWWLVAEPDPPDWFVKVELEGDSIW